MFQSLFGRAPEAQARASGRVNLIGEHTDYNGGFVLPMAIPQGTTVAIAARTDGKVRVASRNQDEGRTIAEFTLGEEKPARHWTSYVQGVTSILRTRGLALRGFEAWIESTVPIGSGLSSSAALEVSLIRALRACFGYSLDDVAIAKLSQQVENEFVGARVGIMDPMAASLADVGSALFLDTLDLSFEKIPFPANAELAVIHSGITHSLAHGDYNTRRSECEKACALLGVDTLRKLGMDDLSALNALPDTLRKRVRHVITENERVRHAVQAMKEQNPKHLGVLFNQSHASLRDDYEVSVPEIDLLVSLAAAESEVFGARITGGGFGGSIVLLVRPGASARVARQVTEAYAQKSGCRPVVLLPE